MADNKIAWLLESLPRLIRENDTVKGAIITALSGVVATKEDIKALISEMDKRFEAMHQQMDKRFETMDHRLDTLDRGQKHTLSILSDIKKAIGVPFEQFARNVVSRIMEGEGIPGVVLKKAWLKDTSGAVFPGNTDVEIDGLSDDPPVIAEITTVLREREKVEKFLKKKAFTEHEKGKIYRGFFVASSSELSQSDLVDIAVLLKRHGSELLNL